jgi:hypothetical protein
MTLILSPGPRKPLERTGKVCTGRYALDQVFTGVTTWMWDTFTGSTRVGATLTRASRYLLPLSLSSLLKSRNELPILVLNGKSGRDEARKRVCGQTRKRPLYFRFHPFSRDRVDFCNLTRASSSHRAEMGKSRSQRSLESILPRTVRGTV